MLNILKANLTKGAIIKKIKLICSLVFPFKKADLILESTAFCFSSMVNCNPREANSLSKPEK